MEKTRRYSIEIKDIETKKAVMFTVQGREKHHSFAQMTWTGRTAGMTMPSCFAEY